MRASQFDVWQNNIVSYSALIGCDYWEHSNYYLSSEIGYIRKGGKETIAGINEQLNLDYLHINTTFRGKYSLDKVSAIYAGIGPKVDVFLNSNKDIEMNQFSFGLKPEVGIFTETKRIRFDVNFSYIYNIGNLENIPDGGGNHLNNDTFSLLFSIGYKL